MGLLVLSFNPLLESRIAFRECDVFFFGTAHTMGGKSSSNEFKLGNPRTNGDQSAVGRKMFHAARCCQFIRKGARAAPQPCNAIDMFLVTSRALSRLENR